MPLAGFVFIFNVGGIAWDVLFGGNSFGSSKGCGLTRKRLREETSLSLYAQPPS